MVDAVAKIADLPLREALALVDARFDAAEIASREFGPDEVAEYYRQSDRGYRLFHSGEGALHIALGCDGGDDTSGFPRQAELFATELDAVGARDAVEFGCGMGYNLRWLAAHRPGVAFTGVDLTDGHARAAERACRGLPNARVLRANYERLPLADGSCDGVLAVETLCQTAHPAAALAEAARVLRPGGRLVVVDCYRSDRFDAFDADTQRAATLVEKTTAVNRFATFAGQLALGEGVGLAGLGADDLSHETAANLARLYRLAKRFFTMPLASRAFGLAFGPRLLENSACGLLMPYAVGAGALQYGCVRMEKPRQSGRRADR